MVWWLQGPTILKTGWITKKDPYLQGCTSKYLLNDWGLQNMYLPLCSLFTREKEKSSLTKFTPVCFQKKLWKCLVGILQIHLIIYLPECSIPEYFEIPLQGAISDPVDFCRYLAAYEPAQKCQLEKIGRWKKKIIRIL